MLLAGVCRDAAWRWGLCGSLVTLEATWGGVGVQLESTEAANRVSLEKTEFLSFNYHSLPNTPTHCRYCLTRPLPQ